MQSFPKILLVGRTNVGKSTLFNRLIQEKKSIVFEREGVTRDYIQETVTWGDKTFDLIDTGGLVFGRHVDDIQKKVQEKILPQLQQAALILFVCDVKNGMTEEDLVIARTLHRSKRPTIILLNKADNKPRLEENMPDFYQLGFKEMLPVSAIHGSGIGDLLNRIIDHVGEPLEGEVEKPRYRVSIIGKPNAGKSSLMNLLIKQERSIVSEVAGTTREAVESIIYNCNDLVQMVDTAGVRKKRNVTDDLETLMVKSSMEAVRTSDVVLLMIDASQGKISDQELKLLFYAFEQKRITLVLFNKVDLLDEYSREMLEQSMDEYKFILKKIPHIWISCLTKRNVSKIFTEIKTLWDRCQQEFSSSEVNEIVQEELLKKPLYHSKMALRVFKIRFIKRAVPTFVLHVNYPGWFGESELGCIENILRKNFNLRGCPIQFSVRKV